MVVRAAVRPSPQARPCSRPGHQKTAIMKMVAVFLFCRLPSFEDGNRSAAVVNDDLNGRQSRGETEPAGETVFPSGSPKNSNHENGCCFSFFVDCHLSKTGIEAPTTKTRLVLRLGALCDLFFNIKSDSDNPADSDFIFCIFLFSNSHFHAILKEKNRKDAILL